LERTAMRNIEVAAFKRLTELVQQTDLPQRPIGSARRPNTRRGRLTKGEIRYGKLDM
jgi:hypothetical protein